MSRRDPDDGARHYNYALRCVQEKIPKEQCKFQHPSEEKYYDAIWKEAVEFEKKSGRWAPFEPAEVD